MLGTLANFWNVALGRNSLQVINPERPKLFRKENKWYLEILLAKEKIKIGVNTL